MIVGYLFISKPTAKDLLWPEVGAYLNESGEKRLQV